MATLNKTREGTRNQKKGICVATAIVSYDEFNAISDISELAELPENAIVTNAFIEVTTAFTALTQMALKSGSDVILPAALVTSLGILTTTAVKFNTDAGAKLTAVVTGANPLAGEAIVVVEYIEYTKNTGEYTDYSTT